MGADLEAIEGEIAENRAAFSGKAAEIRDDPRLSDSAKADDLQAAFAVADEEHKRLRALYDATVTETSRSLWVQAFGPPGGGLGERPDGPEALTRARLHSDALEKAASAKDEADLERLMRNALMSGDQSLAAAVADVALRRGRLGVVEQYGRAYPHRAASVNEFLAFESQHNLTDKARNLELQLRMPGPSLRYQGGGGSHPVDGRRRG